jgi:nicotinamidase-related amidase
VYHLHKKNVDMWKRDHDGFFPAVQSITGSVAIAYALPEFVLHQLLDNGIHKVKVWGLLAEGSVKHCIKGFLAAGFDVSVVLDLCRSRTHDDALAALSASTDLRAAVRKGTLRWVHSRHGPILAPNKKEGRPIAAGDEPFDYLQENSP